MPRITNFANVHNIRLQQLLTEYYLIYVYANPFILNNNWYNSSLRVLRSITHESSTTINFCRTKFYTPFLLQFE